MIIWSKPNCPHCEYAKTLLRTHNIQYEERIIGEEWTKEQLLEAVPTARSVPQIIDGNTYVGGYTDLQKYLAL